MSKRFSRSQPRDNWGDSRGRSNPTQIGKIVAKVLKKGQAGGRLGHRALCERWERVAGPLGAISKPRRLAGNVLEVVVSSAAGIQELTIRTEELLGNLAGDEGPQVHSLRFRLGVFE